MRPFFNLCQWAANSGSACAELLLSRLKSMTGDVADAIGAEPYIFLRGLYFDELGVAERLLGLTEGSTRRHGGGWS